MKIGVKVGAPIQPVTWARTRAMALAVEEAGFDSVWVEDHHLEPNGGPLEAWVALSALGAVTQTVNVGSIVASLNFHESPLILASKIASLVDITSGQFIAGVGAGDSSEAAWLGLPSNKPVGRFIEMFEVTRRLLAGERFSYSGEFIQLEDAFLAASHPVELCEGLPSSGEVQPVPVRWMVGSRGPRMCRETLPYAEGWTTHWSDPDFNNKASRFADLSIELDSALDSIDLTPDSLWRAAEVWVQTSGALGLPIPTPDRLVPVAGGPNALATGLADFASSGVDHLIVLLDPQTVSAVEELAEARDLYLAGTTEGD